MWATFFTLLGVVLVTSLSSLLHMSWELVFFLFVGYMMYLPRKWDSLRRSLPGFRWLREDHCQLSYTGRVDILDEKKARIFAFHPHGVHCVAASLVCSDPRMSHIRVAATYFLFWVPIIKEFCAWGGAFSCDYHKIKSALNANLPVILYPGGISELPDADFLRETEYRMKKDEDIHSYVYTRRKGFIDIAMDQEVSIVPVWVAGETELYDVFHPFPLIQRFFYNLVRYPWPLVSIGWKWMPFLPKPNKVTIWVGDPIPINQNGDPDKYHKLYLKGLRKLIEKSKAGEKGIK